MWNNKKKALTFSFDDGVTQDVRLIGLFNKYGMKATFNLNSGYLGTKNSLVRNDVRVTHNKIDADKIAEVYQGHEVAVHTLTHPSLPDLSDYTVVRQVEEDRIALERLVGYSIHGMAYPNGTYDRRVAELIKNNTPIEYSRTTESTFSFTYQAEDLTIFHPTIYFIEVDKMFELGKEFLNLKPEKPSLYYIWGHSYEMDAGYIAWE